MTEPDDVTLNLAASGATVGMQAEQINNSTVHVHAQYQLSADPTPREKYEVGVRYLENGSPNRARELIADAIAHGHDSAEARFHWALAMLSKRSYRDLAPAEREQLADVAASSRHNDDEEWTPALEVVWELLDYLRNRSHPKPVLKKLLDLPPAQREKIERHLDLVLMGGMKDDLWATTRHRAGQEREGHQRTDRVWAYFQPDPAAPRTRPPTAQGTTDADWFAAVVWTGLCMLAGGYLGWIVLTLARPIPILAYAATLAVGYVAARLGLEWRYRSDRLKAKDREFRDQDGGGQAPERGFANSVDHAFAHYFAIYVPHGVERDVWLAETAGIRTTLRNEIVEIYRESRIPAGAVRWLIRYLVTDVSKRWEAGTLWDYRERYQVARSTKAQCLAAATVCAVATVNVVATAITVHPFLALLALAAAVKGARTAAARWLYITSERRRLKEDRQDYEHAEAQRAAAYERWMAKLNAARPSESEMEHWLDCDKTILLGNALRHYHLLWRDVIAYALLQVPARHYKRARVKRGPWRYSKYDIRLFLVTKDGVREVSSELDFEHITLREEYRTNYRFAAISSVHVARANESSYTLELTLTNGPTKSLRITEPETTEPAPDEDPVELAKINLDATGLTHTLHVLEGIAAEGRAWIDRNLHATGTVEDPL